MKKEFGQYFTPLSVAKFIINNTKINKDAAIIDPSVGEGVFFKAILGKNKENEMIGIDLDKSIIKLNRKIFKENSNIRFIYGNGLDSKTFKSDKNNKFDIVVGNPPFNNKYNRISDDHILYQYHYLSRDKQSPEVLFLERFTNLLKPKGYLRIILPIGIFFNSNLQYVRNFIISNLDIEAIVSLPRNCFYKTTTKTVILFARRYSKKHLGFSNINLDKPIKLFKINNIENIENININKDYCINKTLGNIATRMDPDYYFAEDKNKKIWSNKVIQFKKLSDIIDMDRGFMKYGKDKKTYDENTDPNIFIKLINAKTINILGFNNIDLYIKKYSNMYNFKSEVNVGDVIVIRVGSGCSGRAFYIKKDKYRGQVDDWFFILRKSKIINMGYLSFFLNSSIGKQFLDQEKQGTNALSINKDSLGNIRIPILEKKDQLYFYKGVSKIYSLYEQGDEKVASELFVIMDKKLTGILTQD